MLRSSAPLAWITAKNFLLKAALIITLIGFLIGIVLLVNFSDRDQMIEFATSRGEHVQSIGMEFGRGPFWFRQRHDRIYRFTTQDANNHRHIYWIRFSLNRSIAEEQPEGGFRFLEM